MDTIVQNHAPVVAAIVPDDSCGLSRGVVIDRFVVLEALGAGGMGVVFAAYDPELDRKVALKLLSPGVGEPGRQARLIREAQALAKLSHPNVVAVHDVGMHGDRLWIAMEFVAGQTLTEWARERPRRWPEVLALLADVARGVAAAHQAGLVHRDLKPDNVMLGADGRVRVMDFGLAHGRSTGEDASELTSTLESEARPQPQFTALAQQLTAVGAIQGTPAYMAPEQWEGHEAQNTTDQFGMCVMAWELLYGERPFSGDTTIALATAVMSGQRRPPPRGRGVPGWLRRVIEHGLAVEPTHRWPTMTALLAALERGKTRARVRAAAVALAGVGLLAASVEGYWRWDIVRRVTVCEAVGADIDRAWNEEARQRLRDAFMATGVSYAATSAVKAIPWLDQRAEAWKQARTAVCLNTDVHETWDSDLADRAMWCLEDRQMEIESLVDELGRADKMTVQKAVTAVASLRMVDDCIDESMLQRQPAPPQIEKREAIREVRRMLSQAHSLSLAARYEDALSINIHANELAVGLDWPSISAAVHTQEGRILERTGVYVESEAASTKAYFTAARAGIWDVAAQAAIDLISSVGVDQARHTDGRVWARHAEVALANAGSPVGPWEAERLNNLASISRATGSYPEAQNLYLRALAIRESTLGAIHPDTAQSLNNLGNVHFTVGAFADARPLYERSLDIRERTLGPNHPAVAHSLTNLANVHINTQAFADARTLLERSLEIYDRTLGPTHLDTLGCMQALAGVHMYTDELAEAQSYYERILTAQEHVAGALHPDIAGTLNNFATLKKSMGAYGEAHAMYHRALDIQEQALGRDHPDVAKTLNNLGTLQVDMGSRTTAQPYFERALTIWEHLGSSHPDFAVALLNLGDLHLTENRPYKALPLLERATAIFAAQEGSQRGENEARFDLAKAIVATDGDRSRAIEEARTAESGFRVAGPGRSDELAEVEQWLIKYTVSPAPVVDDKRATTGGHE